MLNPTLKAAAATTTTVTSILAAVAFISWALVSGYEQWVAGTFLVGITLAFGWMVVYQTWTVFTTHYQQQTQTKH